MTTPVVFRKFSDGEIIALFPDQPGDSSPYTCLSYVHNGQHGSASPWIVVQLTSLAEPEEYSDLLEELVSLGYDDLKIYQRITQKMTMIRDAELKRIKQ